MSTVPSRTRSLRKPTIETNQNGKSTAGSSAETSMRGRSNQSPSRLPKPPSTTSIGHSRTTSTSRPGNSGNASIRAPSQKTGVSRPPLTSDNRSSSHRSGAKTPTESNSSLQRASSTRHTRNSSTSALPSTSRPGSVTQIRSTRTTSNAAPPAPNTASSSIRPPSSTSHRSSSQSQGQGQADGKTAPRPAFSTLQQHFSPLKSLGPKPATATFLAPPSPSKLPSNIQISAETARLQTELLQLHLLHRDAATVARQFRGSARGKLQARFEDVASAHVELAELEAEDQDRVNALALKAWAESGVGWALADKIQVLDQVLAGVWKISEPGGKYMRVVRRFERWVGKVWDLLEERRRGEGGEDGEVRFLEELDDEWREECGVMARKLEGWRVQLRDLDGLTGKSSLCVVVRGIGDLVHGMSAEVQAMERVDREVMYREEQWIKEALDAESDDEGPHPEPGPLWRIR